MAEVWPTFYSLVKTIDFEFALGRALGGSWEAGLGLEILPKTIAFTPLNISPIGCIQPRFIDDFCFNLRLWNELSFSYIPSQRTARRSARDGVLPFITLMTLKSQTLFLFSLITYFVPFSRGSVVLHQGSLGLLAG